ncbi:polysaccharide pyruvyl transferase family protein [Streptomyces sodiiphilus]|uniref:polysaccharide pyruvyl transferase family protein n=1 Tax=Streptomyces sodiiphilus TaxID=226217 RepID=UPI0031CDE7E4
MVTREDGTAGRTLVTGWFSFLDGEVTAGDVLALRRVREVLDRAGLPYDVAWRPGFRPGLLSLDDVRADGYTRLLFVCGPLAGSQVSGLHRQFSHCRRIAVGVSVIDPADPAVTGFHEVLARDAQDRPVTRDLAVRAPLGGRVPVVGVVLTDGQGEYGPLRMHTEVAGKVGGWLAGRDCAPVVLQTRLDSRDGMLCSEPEQVVSALERVDTVITDRLHGLVLALRAGVPPIVIDPVRGGAKVSAQAHACRWPALVPGEALSASVLDAWWAWCASRGREAARHRRAVPAGGPDAADELAALLASGGTRPAASAVAPRRRAPRRAAG